jgi:hypothetical protein
MIRNIVPGVYALSHRMKIHKESIFERQERLGLTLTPFQHNPRQAIL